MIPVVGGLTEPIGRNAIVDLIWIIVVVAVIWGIASGLVKLREAAGKGIHRAIRPGAYQKGKELAGREVALTAPVPPALFIDRVVYTLDAQPEAPLMGGLYVESREVDDEGDHVLVVAQGTKLITNFRMGMVVSPQDDGAHCSGVVSVLQWHETEGVMDGADRLERVFHHVQEAASYFGGESQ